MIDFNCLSKTGCPLLIPGAHDAFCASIIEAAGFSAYGVGGAALAATQLALPDAGLQSFGEYRDAVARIIEGSDLPLMVDGENGFGDVKAVTRTVQSFEKMGVDAIAFEDLVMPPKLGQPPKVVSREEINAKIKAALNARKSDGIQIIARTDSAYAVSVEEAIARVTEYAAFDVDGLIVPGLPNLDAYQQLRDAVNIPIIAVVATGSPWFTPSVNELIQVGIEAAVYPTAIISRLVLAIQEGLEAIRSENGALPAGFDLSILGNYLKTSSWAEIDNRP
jgi:2-methylisocitrate lyase-like PEP mutase family enzyme